MLRVETKTKENRILFKMNKEKQERANYIVIETIDILIIE